MLDYDTICLVPEVILILVTWTSDDWDNLGST